MKQRTPFDSTDVIAARSADEFEFAVPPFHELTAAESGENFIVMLPEPKLAVNYHVASMTRSVGHLLS